MPLIKKQKKEVLKPVTIRIEEGLLNRLTEYAAYLDSSREYVIGEAIRYVVDRDKEFSEKAQQDLHQNLHQDPHRNPHQDLHQEASEIPQQAAKASK